jgi:uncharacterized membrane protein YdcZ (DUF606 family)
MKNLRHRIVNSTISALVGSLILIIISLIKDNEVDWAWVIGFVIVAFLFDLIVKSTVVWSKKRK